MLELMVGLSLNVYLLSLKIHLLVEKMNGIFACYCELLFTNSISKQSHERLHVDIHGWQKMTSFLAIYTQSCMSVYGFGLMPSAAEIS